MMRSSALRREPPPVCSTDCVSHPEHVYVLCFGQPTTVASRDYLRQDKDRNYPVTHYVGYTSQQPPLRRIKQHGVFCADQLVLVLAGNELLERQVKALAKCPTCKGSLWYYSESPAYQDSYAPPVLQRLWQQHPETKTH